MKGYIYKITNKVNGKSYIGQTRYTVEFRWRQHQHKKDNCYFHNALQKYGADNFIVETLEECDFKDLDSREIFYIAKYDTFATGYNTTIGGDGKRKIVTDNQYDEIKGLYLSGFSSNKIADLYKVNKTTILKILHSMNVKLRSNKLNINNQEFQELVADYRSGFSLKELAKRYDCSAVGLKDYLRKKGVDLRNKYHIMQHPEDQEALVRDYLDSRMSVDDIMHKYHCSWNVFKRILSLHGINNSQRRRFFSIDKKDCLYAISLFNQGLKIKEIANKLGVTKSVIYSVFRYYHVDYRTV